MILVTSTGKTWLVQGYDKIWTKRKNYQICSLKKGLYSHYLFMNPPNHEHLWSQHSSIAQPFWLTRLWCCLAVIIPPSVKPVWNGTLSLSYNVAGGLLPPWQGGKESGPPLTTISISIRSSFSVLSTEMIWLSWQDQKQPPQRPLPPSRRHQRAFLRYRLNVNT